MCRGQQHGIDVPDGVEHRRVVHCQGLAARELKFEWLEFGVLHGSGQVAAQRIGALAQGFHRVAGGMGQGVQRTVEGETKGLSVKLNNPAADAGHLPFAGKRVEVCHICAFRADDTRVMVSILVKDADAFQEIPVADNKSIAIGFTRVVAPKRWHRNRKMAPAVAPRMAPT